MTVVNPKSISGINSITTGSGSDNLLTIHTSDASSTERVRINSSGDVIVGSGITVSPDGDIFTTGVTTATTFVGALTGNVTGTLQTAAQTNITSVGSLSSLVVTGGITATGGNIVMNDSSGSSANRIKFGTSQDFSIYHNGTTTILDNNTGNLQIDTTANEVHNVQSEFQVKVKGGDEDGLKVITDGAVELYHDNTKKLTTDSTGIDINTGGTEVGTKIKMYGSDALTRTQWGYSSAYKGIILGRTDVNNNSTIFMGYDPTGNTSGAFTGDGREIVFRNNTSFVTPTSANNSWNTPIRFGRGTSTEGAINFPNGVLFQNDQADANILDDYEEGTWTPDWRGASALGTTTYGSYNVASYVKIGNQVTVRGYSELNGSSGGSGFWFINNLPFTVGGGDNRAYRSVGSVMIENYDLPTDTLDVVLYVERNNNDAQLRSNRDNAQSGSNISVNTDTNFEIFFTVTYPTV